MVEGNSFAIIDLLLGLKSIYLFFIWLVEGWFPKKISSCFFFSFYFMASKFFMLFFAPLTLQGSRNIQGFAVIRAVLLNFIWRVGRWLSQKISNITFNFFSCYYCSVKIKRQSELSGLRPDTSSLITYFTVEIKPNRTNVFHNITELNN